MKITGLIMACWLLFLSFVPCGDRQDCSVAADAVVTAGTDHQQHDQDIEHCTPFCSCACCASSTVSPSPVFFTLNKKGFGKMPYADYHTGMFSNISCSIWQPPRA